MLRTLSLVVPLVSTGCLFPHVYHEQERVLVRGLDVDASLEIARSELAEAYRDACSRPGRLMRFKDIASGHVNGRKICMGDVHAAARAFARSHVVAPRNPKYIQSLEQYRQNKEKKP